MKFCKTFGTISPCNKNALPSTTSAKAFLSDLDLSANTNGGYFLFYLILNLIPPYPDKQANV